MGSGNSINIVGQPWLLDPHNPFITSTTPGLSHNKVSSLMSMSHRGWDEDILTDMFNDRDQQCIRNVQLREDAWEDSVYWSREASGHFSVRSAYRLLQAQKQLWRQEANDSFWRKIWRIKAPPKVLNLVWRSLSYCLPTKVMLHQKHVPVDRLCPVCMKEEETISHALIGCSFAVQCWQLLSSEV